MMIFVPRVKITDEDKTTNKVLEKEDIETLDVDE